jgi:hypothetical protein
MFRDTEAFRTPAPCAASPSPDAVDATLAFLASSSDKIDRILLAIDSRWLWLGEIDPEFCGHQATIAARSIMTQPAIVWG